jgi:hypothetical protein
MMAKYERCSGTTIITTGHERDYLVIYYKGVRIAKFKLSVIRELLREADGTTTDTDNVSGSSPDSSRGHK